ncbi:BZ3500_MvSof-1268-A1-R1_Chr2-1g04636 [Microbotryum saponariae]|uniref:BZ3500_MvSof-1268-A1-R1_Chr2-1g04636 protein n=1 Tax=Microbotryum saponariae TaxID=289078 RepID=A0A2X0L8Z7_9BASI|nr:BZ3500_MvSof-1268-A1-R1_Chr2-1g04636 [Microbotryum saponariae]SCZ92163.1 BZ3501_MvSof-1269-A2-R1_Chr2-1g04292 [Microbotryum saponariae]
MIDAPSHYCSRSPFQHTGAVIGPSMTALIARHQVLMRKKTDISSMSAWLQKDQAQGREGWQGIEQDLLGWMKERNLSFAAILTSFSESNEENPEGKAVHAREIVLYVGGEGNKVQRLREVLFSALQDDQVLKVEKWKGGAVKGLKDERGWRVWSQGEFRTLAKLAGNARATRKQVAPVTPS